MDSLCKLFETKPSQEAQKALDYLDGLQLQYVVDMLNEPSQGRAFWKEKGMRARYRNLTKRVVEKSSQLFTDEPPAFEVWQDSDTPDENQTAAIVEIYSAADVQSFCVNLDLVTRLLKTSLVLQQFSDETDTLVFDLLHRGNAYVEFHPVSRQPTKIVVKLDSDESDEWEYFRIWTADTIEDWREKKGAYEMTAEMYETQDNPYGVIPVTPFYDSTMPRTGFWCRPGMDLIHFNEAYNMHMVDMDFAASWSVNQTLYTNVNFADDEIPGVQVEEVYKQPLPRMTNSAPSQTVMGLGKVVQIDTSGVEQVYLEFKGPTIDFTGPTQMFNSWMHDYAADWSVRVKMTDGANARSGFQLVVEEIDNLELRRQRSRMMERSLKHMMYMSMHIWNIGHGQTFSDSALAFVSIPDANLPIDSKAEEETWSMKISEGRASRIDYFMKTEGMTQDEAEAKVEEIDQYRGGTVQTPQNDTEDQ